MNPERLLQHFDRIAEAPDAIPRLRQFILDLAVRGKLVEQDPNDEPAAAQLSLCDQMRQATAKEDRRADTDLQTLLAAEDRWDVPSPWEWRALADIVLFIDYRGQTPRKVEKGVRLVTAKNVKKGFISLSPEEFLSEGNYDIWMTRGLPEKGDVLFTTEAPMGNAAVMRLAERFALAQRVICFRNYGAVNPDFLVLQLLAEPFQSILDKTATGLTAKGIKAAKLKRLPVVVPPLAEQHRIVAKVDELMALCDQLEAAKTEREQSRDRLVAASLHRLNPPADAEANAPEAFRDHARFVFNHLPRLTTHPEHIKQLRQTILNLAVRGKLVPQDPNDESASELLKRIQAEKARLVKEGKIKKEKLLVAIQTDTAPFEIPENWEWVRLGELTEIITKGSSPNWQGVEYVSKDNGTLFVTSENVDNYRLRKMEEPKYVEKRFNEIEPRSILRFGDILMNLVGASIGRTAIYDLHDEANINQAVALIRLVHSKPNLCADFLLHYFNSPFAIQLMLASRVVTAQPNMSLTDAREFPIPLPPLAEQHRIVAKVDELMALCDQLEAQLTTTEGDSRRLLEAVLHEALTPTH